MYMRSRGSSFIILLILVALVVLGVIFSAYYIKQQKFSKVDLVPYNQNSNISPSLTNEETQDTPNTSSNKNLQDPSDKLPDYYNNVFDGKFKNILRDIFAGKISYIEKEGNVYFFNEAGSTVYGVRSYLYDANHSTIERTVGFGSGEKVIYDLSKEITTFNNLTTTPTNVQFFSFFLGEGYRDVLAKITTVNGRKFAVYDTCSPYAGSQARNYFRFDKNTNQILYIKISFYSGCNSYNKEENDYIQRFEEEVLSIN